MFTSFAFSTILTLLSVTSMVSAGSLRALQTDEIVCDSELVACSLVDRNSQAPVAVLDDSVIKYDSAEAEYSILCETTGTLDYFMFYFDEEEHRENKLPYYMGGDWNGKIKPAEYLDTCGRKVVSVAGFKDGVEGPCFEASFILRSPCEPDVVECEEGYIASSTTGECVLSCYNPFGNPCGPGRICFEDEALGHTCEEDLGDGSNCPVGCPPSEKCVEGECECKEGYVPSIFPWRACQEE